MCPASEQKATCSCMKLILVKYWNYSQRSFKVYLPFTGWNGTPHINTQAKDRVLIPHGKAHGCQDVPPTPCWQQRRHRLHCSCSAHPSAPSDCGSAGTDSRGRMKPKGLLQIEHGNRERNMQEEGVWAPLQQAACPCSVTPLNLAQQMAFSKLT